ncbi:MAG: hypothetical protein IPJ88_05220 [Myxococcales bacterium]|nr:MAG: hypothetical protein IPJ88_05220 [Myxococcales bacterium]
MLNPKKLTQLGLFVGLLLSLTSFSGKAQAYYWMVRHGYTNCANCHADPSGGSLLTAYGRAQGELLLKTHYSDKDAEDPGPGGELLFGLVDFPSSVLVGAEFRGLAYSVFPKKGSTKSDAFLMQSDALAQIRLGRFRANASIGFAQSGASGAAITSNGGSNLVSRAHWLGLDLGSENQFLLRAGRFNLPFGIRSIEHTTFVRSITRTDINAAQNHGVALSYNDEHWRTELMALLGNFQTRPDKFRERGYAGYLEYAWTPTLATGLTSLTAYSALDARYQTSLLRQAHGLFVRYAPWQPLVLSVESDLLIDAIGDNQSTGSKSTTQLGIANLVQADYELIQGLHFIGIGELYAPSSGAGLSYSAWGGIDWFFYSHLDLRVDTVYQSYVIGADRTHAVSLVAQLHGYL